MTGLGDVTGWVLDVDGCLVQTSRAGGAGGTLIPGAAELVTHLQAAGHRVLVCTNASEQPPATYAAHLRGLGLPIADEDLVTAGSAGAAHIAAHHPGARVLAVGGDGITRPLQEHGLVLHDGGDPTACDAVLVGAAATYTYVDIDAACLAVEAGATLYVSQDQPWFHGGRGRSVAISAVIAAALTWVTKVDAVVTGKPSAVLAESLLDRLGRAPSRVAVVGDARAEIQLARHMGACSVAVLSGALHLDDIAALAPPLHPDHVVDDVALGVVRGTVFGRRERGSKAASPRPCSGPRVRRARTGRRRTGRRRGQRVEPSGSSPGAKTSSKSPRTRIWSRRSATSSGST